MKNCRSDNAPGSFLLIRRAGGRDGDLSPPNPNTDSPTARMSIHVYA